MNPDLWAGIVTITLVAVFIFLAVLIAWLAGWWFDR